MNHDTNQSNKYRMGMITNKEPNQKESGTSMTNQFIGNENPITTTGARISSIVDTLISLRFTETDSRIQRDLVIIKSRGANHSNRHHLYDITDDGIHINPLKTLKGGTQ